MNPARRVRLDQDVGDCLVLPQASQEMDMVGDAIGEQTKATLTANRATQVLPQPGPQFALKPRFPVLGGKHKVIEKAGIGMGHEAPAVRIRHPSGVWSGCGDCAPGLRCGAGAPPPDPGLGILRPLSGATPAILSPVADENEAEKCRNSRGGEAA
jgi:hypothetical protein